MSTEPVEVDFDPTELGGWAEVDDVCDVTMTVTVGGAVYGLRCEQDAGHEPPHGGILYWADGPESE